MPVKYVFSCGPVGQREEPGAGMGQADEKELGEERGARRRVGGEKNRRKREAGWDRRRIHPADQRSVTRGAGEGGCRGTRTR